jgi:hypothetical protein
MGALDLKGFELSHAVCNSFWPIRFSVVREGNAGGVFSVSSFL